LDDDSSEESSEESGSGESAKPNVVYFIADDLGYADVGYMDSDVLTPNIDALAADGTILKEAYANPVCTPSRSALMTGIYAYKTKVQHLVITDQQKACVPTDLKFLPERFLKKLPVISEDERSLRKTQEAINKRSSFAELE